MKNGRGSYFVFTLLLVLVGALLAALPVSLRLSAMAADMIAGGQPIALAAAGVPLNPNDRGATKVGQLRYRGGLYVTSSDRRFGGFSGLIVSADGKRLLSNSDRAYWLSANLSYSGGRLSGLSGGVLAPILGADGKPLKAPSYDCESITSLGGFPLDGPGGALEAGFESRDRVDQYNLGKDGFLARPVRVAMPEALKAAVVNKGLEGIAHLPDGRLLAITERTLDAQGNMIGWIVEPSGASVVLSLKREAPFDLSDLALGPDGNVYTLERRYTPISGPGMRIRRIKHETLQAGAVLDGEVIADMNLDYSIDNMEGLAIRKSEDGSTLFYLISDDNYSAAERTLLLMFSLEE